MFRKHDVRIPAEGGIQIPASLFVPEGQAAPLPAIRRRLYLPDKMFSHSLGQGPPKFGCNKSARVAVTKIVLAPGATATARTFWVR